MYKENDITELKREYTDEIKRTVVAFANTNGGTIYIGIEDDGAPCGVNNVDDTIKKITQSCLNSIKPDITMFFKVENITIEEKDIVKVTVLSGSDKPYYLAEKGLKPNGVLIRVGACTVPSSEDYIKKLIKTTDNDKYIEGLSIEQDLTFEYANGVFEKQGVVFDKSKFSTLGITDKNGAFTNLGLLISDQCNHTIKVAIFEGVTKSIFRDRKEFSGSIFKQLDDVSQYLEINNKTHATFEGLTRIDKQDYPSRAIREALLNAVVHREYSYSGSTLINLYDDRLEFVTLGGVVQGLTLESIMQGVSQTRNDNLAKIFYRIKFVEAYGTGIARIMDEYTDCEMQPKITITDGSFSIVLPNKNYVGNNKMKAKQSEKANVDNITLQEQKVLNLFKQKEYITIEDIKNVAEVATTRAYKIINEMIEKKLLDKVKTKNGTGYIHKIQ